MILMEISHSWGHQMIIVLRRIQVMEHIFHPSHMAMASQHLQKKIIISQIHLGIVPSKFAQAFGCIQFLNISRT